MLRSPYAPPSVRGHLARGASQALYPQAWRGLVAAWHFGAQGASNTLYDLSGNGHHATLNGNPTWGLSAVAPYLGPVGTFDGTGDYFSVAFTPPNAGTVVVYLRHATTGDRRRIMAIGDNYEVLRHETSGFSNDLFASGSTNLTSSTSAGNDTAWHHFSAAYNGTTNLMKLWTDGKPDGENFNADDPAGSGTLTIGIRSGSGGQDFQGDLLYLAIYDRVLTDKEVLLDYQWAHRGGALFLPRRRRFVVAAGAALTISETDAVTVGEAVTVRFNPLLAAVSDAVTVGETVAVRFDPLLAAVSDAVTVGETVRVHPLLMPAVSDAVTVGEAVTLLLVSSDVISILVTDAVTVGEAVTLHLPVYISVSDAVVASDATLSVRPGAQTPSRLLLLFAGR